MKTLLVLALCLGSFGAFSHDHEEMEGKTFQEKKTMMTEKLDKKQQMISEAKSCVSAANDEAALKECKKKMWEEKKEMKKEMKDKKKKKK